MAYSAKCDTSPPTKWWITGTGSVVNRLSEVMDDNAAGVEFDDDPGVYEPWTTFMTEHIEDKSYQVHLDLEIGDGSTPTTLLSKDEFVYWDSGAEFTIKNSASLTLGVLTEGEGVSGSFWYFDLAGDLDVIVSGQTTAIFNMYGSRITKTGNQYIHVADGDIVLNNSVIDCGNPGWSSLRISNYQNLTIKDLLVENAMAFRMDDTGASITNLHVTNTRYGFYSWIYSGGATITLTGGKFTDYDGFGSFFYVNSTTNPLHLVAVDVEEGTGTPTIVGNEGNSVTEKYTINIHVADKTGGAIANTATVACKRANVVTESTKFYKCIEAHTSGTFADDLAAGKWEEITDSTILDAAPAWLTTTDYVSAEAEFSENPTNGAIAEQIITYKKWAGTSELETKYIHTFTTSETGYETLTLDNITVGGPIDWHLGLQPQKQPPALWQEGMM